MCPDTSSFSNCYFEFIDNLWWAGGDLNSRPFGYQPNAIAMFSHSNHAELPALRNRIEMVAYLKILKNNIF